MLEIKHHLIITDVFSCVFFSPADKGEVTFSWQYERAPLDSPGRVVYVSTALIVSGYTSAHSEGP